MFPRTCFGFIINSFRLTTHLFLIPFTRFNDACFIVKVFILIYFLFDFIFIKYDLDDFFLFISFFSTLNFFFILSVCLVKEGNIRVSGKRVSFCVRLAIKTLTPVNEKKFVYDFFLRFPRTPKL
jgi:hypothetical protein